MAACHVKRERYIVGETVVERDMIALMYLCVLRRIMYTVLY